MGLKKCGIFTVHAEIRSYLFRFPRKEILKDLEVNLTVNKIYTSITGIPQELLNFKRLCMRIQPLTVIGGKEEGAEDRNLSTDVKFTF